MWPPVRYGSASSGGDLSLLNSSRRYAKHSSKNEREIIKIKKHKNKHVESGGRKRLQYGPVQESSCENSSSDSQSSDEDEDEDNDGYTSEGNLDGHSSEDLDEAQSADELEGHEKKKCGESLLASTRRRREPFKNLTISDDRSIGSEFEQDARILAALKPRETRQDEEHDIQPHGPPASPQPPPPGYKPGPPPVHLGQDAALQALQALHAASRPPHIFPQYSPMQQMEPPPPRSPISIQSYIPETIPPWNGNRKRQSKSASRSFADPRKSNLESHSSEVKERSESLEVNAPLNDTQTTSLPLTQPNDASDYELSITESFSHATVIQSSNEKGEVSGLDTHGLESKHADSIESVQAYVTELERKVADLEHEVQKQEPNTFQIIHRIFEGSRRTPPRMFLDQPQWIIGEGRKTLESRVPLSSVPLYLGSHPELAFVIFRDYYAGDGEGIDLEFGEALIPQAQHTSEKIYVATQDLADAIFKYLRINRHYYTLRQDFAEKGELPAPYLFFYHYRSQLEVFESGLADQQQRQFKMLLDYVLSQYTKEYESVDALIKRGKISPQYLIYLFTPGDLIVDGKDHNTRGYMSTGWLASVPGNGRRRTKGTPNVWLIRAVAWAFDGEFSVERHVLELKFDTADLPERSIEELDLRPLKLMSKEVTAALRRRGEIFWRCRTKSLVSYRELIGNEKSYNGDERYMIDLNMYHQIHKKDKGKKSSHGDYLQSDLSPEEMARDKPPNEEFNYILPPTIKGYNLKRKKWLDIQVDRITEVKWNKEAFESLVLDRKTKRLIQALVTNQLESEKSTDLISGKGNGLILLLHGGPGTGKTLTAESVAEIAEKPLYPVTCGDIGTEPGEVEIYLESVLTLGKTWGCVVLLDEADVFLEQRSLDDLRRNALVSVFLRVLEYYEGILILTSNRVGIFDEAFKSRIQLALHYANLSTYQRTQIWKNFIRRLEKLEEKNVDFDDLKDHLEQLSKNKMNGREIRNAITTARQYAKFEGKILNYQLLQEIIEIAGRFDTYIEKLNGGYSQDQLAEDEGLRLSKMP